MEWSCNVQGLCTPLAGTTIVHMERLFYSDTATMSWVFTVSSFGYIFGAVICGFVFDYFNHELQLLIANCIEAVTILVAPFFSMLPLFIAMLFIHTATHGFITAGEVPFLSRFVVNMCGYVLCTVKK